MGIKKKGKTTTMNSRKKPSDETGDDSSGLIAVHHTLLQFEKRHMKKAIIVVTCLTIITTGIWTLFMIYPYAENNLEKPTGLLWMLGGVILVLISVITYAINKARKGVASEKNN